MSSLYNKYCPKNLEDVLGQDVIKEIIKGLEPDKLPNAILLSGIYGSGKTLLAKIIAKKFNCIADKKPCNVCENCLVIDNNIEDIIEIDAATNNTTESIRELVNTCPYLPYKLKYKVYIIDEIHTLVGKAFDALLMTLQDPPKHVKFIFATTNLSKIPMTFLSRCILLPVSKVAPRTIFFHLKSIVEYEKKDVPEIVIKEIAKNCGGSVRHALTMIEPVLLMENIHLEAVLQFLKILQEDKVMPIFKNILNGDVSIAIREWQVLSKLGYSEKDFLHRLAAIVNNIFLETHPLKEQYEISNNILVQFWSIINFQLEALYTNEVPFVIEMTLKMLSIVQECDIQSAVKKYFEIKPKKFDF